MKQFFITLPGSVINCFKPRMLLWHALAIALTAILVFSGFDWWFYQATHAPEIRSLMFHAVRIGFFLPIWLPLILFLLGYTMRNTKVVQTGWALLQAEIAGLLISSGYKAITGRDHPLRAISQDNSQVFHFGFLRNGVFWGWPSSHTTIAFAMGLVVLGLYPRSRWLCWVAILYAFYVGLGVAVTIHWFSDFVAGAIIGALIGTLVSRNFPGKQN